MNHIHYLTVDLLIYNLIQGLGEDEAENIRDYQEFWSCLPKKLKQAQISVVSHDIDSGRLNFENQSKAIDGFYSRTNFDDTDCFGFSCSLDTQLEPHNFKSSLHKLKGLAILPQFKNPDLVPGRLSERGYLGQTWMISGWIDSANTDTEKLAYEAYEALISQKHQYQQQGEFLGATLFEMWRGSHRWQGIEKDSYVMFILYPSEATFAEASKYYNAWRYLFYCRHKIVWAYTQGRELKERLYKSLIKTRDDASNLSKRDLKQLKTELQTNINSLSRYVLELNDLEIQQHTIEVNLDNYQKQCEDYFNNQKFLQEFSNVANKKYKVQLEKDYASLHTGISILENQTATIRGMVEIEQAERDRTFQTIVGVAGVGIGTGSIVAGAVSPFVEGITQQPFKTNDKLLPSQVAWLNITTAFSISIALGFLFALITWLAIVALQRSRSHPPSK